MIVMTGVFNKLRLTLLVMITLRLRIAYVTARSYSDVAVYLKKSLNIFYMFLPTNTDAYII